MRQILAVVSLFFALVSVAQAEESGEDSPWSYRLSMGGNFVTGNLYQIQLNGSGRLTYDRGRVQNRLMANGFRLWIRTGSDEVALFGDDVTLGDLFTLRANDRLSYAGLTYLSWSQLHQIDLQLGAGAGPMVELLDGTKQSLRIGPLGFVEQTRWPGTSFNRPIDHTDGVRTIPRLSVLSSFHLTAPDTPVSFQGLAYLHVNPLDVGDIRGLARGSADLQLIRALKVSLSGQVAGSSVVLEGVNPVDTRVTVGLTLVQPDARPRDTLTD